MRLKARRNSLLKMMKMSGLSTAVSPTLQLNKIQETIRIGGISRQPRRRSATMKATNGAYATT